MKEHSGGVVSSKSLGSGEQKSEMLYFTPSTLTKDGRVWFGENSVLRSSIIRLFCFCSFRGLMMAVFYINHKELLKYFISHNGINFI